MHSRIFQVSLNPIVDKSDYIVESDYWDHWFLNEIADWVSDDCDRDEDIKWLQDCVKGIVFDSDENGKYFVVENKEEYFKRDFEIFKEVLDKIKNCTLKDFAEGCCESELWKLKNAYEETYSFYVDVDGELMTFDRFVRLYTEGAKYYIGGIVYYHY